MKAEITHFLIGILISILSVMLYTEYQNGKKLDTMKNKIDKIYTQVNKIPNR